MKIVNIPRFILFLVIIMFVISLCTNILTKTVLSASPIEYETVVVAEGDTLWSIAMNLEGNISENVYQIKKINHLNNSMIYVGQELQIPVTNG